MSDLHILSTPDKPVLAEIELPESKSIALRRLMAAAAGGFVPDAGLDPCADAVLLRDILLLDPKHGEVDAGPCGAAMRFLTAYYAALPGRRILLGGSPRMEERPIGPLVEALRGLGASIEFAGKPGYPPLLINGRRLRGGEVSVDASASSQFVSALMLAAPLCAAPLGIRLAGDAVSRPYIEMTAAVMRQCGVEVDLGASFISISGRYRRSPDAVAPERDWSAAAFIFEALLALPPGSRAQLPGLSVDSLQGDRIAASLFSIERDSNGRWRQVSEPCDKVHLERDMSAAPDLVPPLAVAMGAMRRPFRLTGVRNLRLKECDRLEALAEGLAQFGITVDTGADYIACDGGRGPQMQAIPTVDPRADHRIAMAFACAAPCLGPMRITDIGCADKSFPHFTEALRRLGFKVRID